MSKLLDKAAEVFGAVKGIYNNTETPPKVQDDEINTPDEQLLVNMADEDYQIFKAHRQPIEDVWRQEQLIWKGDQWAGLRPPDNGPYPERMEYKGNYAGSQIESITSRLTAWNPSPEFEPTEPGDEPRADLLNAFIPYELNCIKIKPKHIRAVRRMVIHGPLMYEVLYNPDVYGGRGNNLWKGQADIVPLNFGSFFPDPSIKDFIYLQKGRAHIINYLMTLEYIKKRWPKQGEKVMADNRSSETEIFDRDSETIVGTSLRNEDNRTTANVLRYMYKGRPKYMSSEDIKAFRERAEQNLAEGIDPSENIAKSKGTAEGIHFLYVTTNGVFLSHEAYVFDHGQYPIIARTLYPEEDNPWGKGYMRDMISPQVMYNRFSELAIEVTSKMGAAAIIYGTAAGLSPGTEGAPNPFQQIWRRFRGKAAAMLPVSDVNQVKELQGVPPNPGIYQYMQHFLEMMQKIPGVYDSTNGAASADVKSGKQAEALMAASQGRMSTAAELIEDAFQEVIEQFVEVCAQHYTTDRVARITGKDVTFNRQGIVKQNPTMTFETGNMVAGPNGLPMPEMMQLHEEYVPKMDVKVNIGVEKPRDREYWIQTAFNLFNTINPMTGLPMIDAKALQYTVQNGRMEPFSVIDERMQTDAMIQQQMQQLQAQNEQLNAQVQAMGSELQKADSAKQQSEQQKQAFEMQKAAGQSELEWAKLNQQERQNEAGNILALEQIRSKNRGSE